MTPASPVRQRIRTRRRDDAGAALVLALLFVTGIGLMVGALLGYTSSTVTAGARLDERAALDSDVGGALALAVNDVRRSTYNFTTGTDRNCLPSGGLSGSDNVTNRYPALTTTSSTGTVVVGCAPGPATGDGSGDVVITTANRPVNAILTLGTSTQEPGLQAGTHVLRVSGPVFSHSDVTVVGTPCPASPQPPTNPSCSELYVSNGAVKARTGCSGKVVSTPAPQCSVPASDPDGADPGYAAPPTATSDLVYRDVPTCTTGSGLLPLQPGYYDDAVALSSWTSGACGNNKTIWLAPGTYYFDFRNSEMPATGTTAVPRGSDVWTVSSGATVIGGQKLGWTNPPIPASKLPGACVSPLESSTAQGVRLYFGGDSRIVQSNGVIELCGTYSASAPPIVIQGARTDSAGVADAPTLTPSATIASTPSGGPQSFVTTPSNGVLAALTTAGDGKIAKTSGSGISRPSNGTALGSVQLSGYPVTVPAGSVLVSARLTVTHREYATLGGDSGSVTATPTGGTAATPVTFPLTSGTNPAMRTDDVDLLPALVQTAHDTGLTGLTLRYDIKAATRTSGNTSLTAEIDRATLVLQYRPPSVRGQRSSVAGSPSCVGAVPFRPSPGGSNCALLDLSGDQSQFYVQGGLYVPDAALDLALPEEGGCSSAAAARCQVAKAGVIARSVRFDIPDVEGSTGDVTVIENPIDSGGPQPLDVYFTAWICPPGTTCTGTPPAGTGWRKAGTALARYTDAGSAPVAGARQVSVRAWNVRPPVP